jgi:biopolymer transport protein TolR
MQNRPDFQANMNVIPFIDIMLVLLIAFMITTPLLISNLSIKLPKGKHQMHDLGPVKISMDQDRHLSWTEPKQATKHITEGELSSILHDYWERHPETEKQVLVEADQRLAYKEVMTLINTLSQSGATGIGLATDPS